MRWADDATMARAERIITLATAISLGPKWREALAAQGRIDDATLEEMAGELGELTRSMASRRGQATALREALSYLQKGSTPQGSRWARIPPIALAAAVSQILWVAQSLEGLADFHEERRSPTQDQEG
jgi:hypothetical protein